ncbi:MAG: hypothetical protein U0R51_01405 [Solirubrobacterales bacterium]
MGIRGFRLPAALAVTAVMLIAGCGGGGDASTEEASVPTTPEEVTVQTGPFDTDEEFQAAASEVCDGYHLVYGAAPVYGVYAPGLVQEYERRVPINEAFQADLESLEPTDGVSDAWNRLVADGAKINAGDEKILAAAKTGDIDKAYEQINDPDLLDVYDDYNAAAEEAGACEPTPGFESQPIAEAAAGAADAPQPSNDVEAAANDWLEALQSGDCERIADANHTQNYAEPAEDCSDLKESEKKSEVLATAQYGPVGAAFIGTDESNAYVTFVLDPKTGELETTSTIYESDTGLMPAPEGIDADENVADAVAAIRDNDPKAFNATLSADQAEEGSFVRDGPFDTISTDPLYGKRFVSDIRDSPDAEPVLLGADNTQAYYTLATEGGDYMLIARHDPGSETDYKFTAYWGLEDVEE